MPVSVLHPPYEVCTPIAFILRRLGHKEARWLAQDRTVPGWQSHTLTLSSLTPGTVLFTTASHDNLGDIYAEVSFLLFSTCPQKHPRHCQLSQVKVKLLVTQSCLTLCNSMDCSLPSSSVHGILQARMLECVAIPFSRGLPILGSNPLSYIAGEFSTI